MSGRAEATRYGPLRAKLGTSRAVALIDLLPATSSEGEPR